MSEFVDRFSWCALQVTLFAAVGATLYLLLRKQSPLRSPLPVRCLTVIAALSLLAVVSWPSWNWLPQTPLDHLPTTINPSLKKNNAPDISSQLNLDLPVDSTPGETTDLLISPTDPLPPVTRPSAQVDSLEKWKKRFVLLAALVGLAALVRLLIATRELLSRTRTSKSIEDASILAEFSQLQTQFRLSRKVSLRESPRDKVPSTIGWRRPIILLPQSWRNWSTSQLRAVLAHELAHVQNHDFATWVAVQVPLLLHSYHPLVHWLARRVRWEQEITADRRAVEVLGDRDAYLTALAELALGQSNRRGPFANFSLAPTSSMLLGRLKMLRQTNSQTVRPAPILRRALLLVVLVLAGLAVSGLRGNNSSDTITITARIAISPPRTNQSDNADQTPNKQAQDIFYETQKALLRSIFILKSAIADETVANSSLLKRHSDPLAWLLQNLKVTRVQNSSILRIQLFSCPREEADNGKKLVDAILQAYRKEVHVKQSESRANLAEMYKDVSDELRTKIDEQQSLTKELGDGSLPITNQMIAMRVGEVRTLNAQITRIKNALIDLEVQKKLAERDAKSPFALKQAIDEALQNDPMLMNYEEQQHDLSQQIMALQSMTQGKNSPQVQKLKQQAQQIAQMAQEQRLRSEAKLREQLKKAPNEKLNQTMAEYGMRQKRATESLAELEAKLVEAHQRIEEMSGRPVKLALLAEEIKQLQKVQETLKSKLQSLDITDTAPHPNIQILQPATADDAPQQPQPKAEASRTQVDKSELDLQFEPSDSSDTVSISALFQFTPPHTSSIGSESQQAKQIEREILFQTQSILLKSEFILKPAIANKTIADSSLLKRHSDPLAWLPQSLRVTRVQNSDILRIQLLHCPREEADNGKKLVGAILETYRREVSVTRAQRREESRDHLSEMRDSIAKELREKISMRNKLALALGESDGSKAREQLVAKRLDRIEANLERLEEEQLLLEIEIEQSASEPSPAQKVQSAFFQQRIAQLGARRDEHLQWLEDRNTHSPKLTMLKSEIEQLQKVHETINLKLLSWDFEGGRDRHGIRIIQLATIDSSPN